MRNDKVDKPKQLWYIDFDIRIKDSGVGISKENLAKLFMNFSKLDEHSSMNHRGTGLGLSICKSLVELMGGSVSVTSELGKGTTFIMSLRTTCKILSVDSVGSPQNSIIGGGGCNQNGNTIQSKARLLEMGKNSFIIGKSPKNFMSFDIHHKPEDNGRHLQNTLK